MTAACLKNRAIMCYTRLITAARARYNTDHVCRLQCQLCRCHRWRDIMCYTPPQQYVCIHIYIYIYICVPYEYTITAACVIDLACGTCNNRDVCQIHSQSCALHTTITQQHMHAQYQKDLRCKMIVIFVKHIATAHLKNALWRERTENFAPAAHNWGKFPQTPATKPLAAWSVGFPGAIFSAPSCGFTSNRPLIAGSNRVG